MRLRTRVRSGLLYLCVSLVGLAGLACRPVSAQERDFFKAERNGNSVVLYAQAQIDGKLETVWRVLTDYARYSDFIPGVLSSRIVKRNGTELLLEQKGEISLWWVTRPLQVTLAVTENPPRVVESILVSGSIKHMRGRYELREHHAGIVLIYSGQITPDEDDVSLIDLVAIRRNASRQFDALILEIERVIASEGR